MTEREYENEYAFLEMYKAHYRMISEVRDNAETPSYLATVPDRADDMTPGAASAILYQLGFTKESARMLRIPKIEDGANLYEPKEPDISDLPGDLFEGIPLRPPLFEPKETPPPTYEQIKEAIRDIEDLTVYIVKQIDALKGDARSKPYFAKFAVSVKAIEMYYP